MGGWVLHQRAFETGRRRQSDCLVSLAEQHVFAHAGLLLDRDERVNGAVRFVERIRQREVDRAVLFDHNGFAGRAHKDLQRAVSS